MKNTTIRSTTCECTASKTKYILYRNVGQRKQYLSAIVPHFDGDGFLYYVLELSYKKDDAIIIDEDTKVYLEKNYTPFWADKMGAECPLERSTNYVRKC